MLDFVTSRYQGFKIQCTGRKLYKSKDLVGDLDGVISSESVLIVVEAKMHAKVR